VKQPQRTRELDFLARLADHGVMGLVIARGVGQTITLETPDGILVEVTVRGFHETERGVVEAKIDIDAPRDVRILRAELGEWDPRRRARRAA
jgi:sRNA-binding carbon storage regulator CsrA